jgi:hypothetical protein
MARPEQLSEEVVRESDESEAEESSENGSDHLRGRSGLKG